MKVEYSGNKQISLTSKTYFCLGDKNKQVSKGVCIHQNPLTFEKYRNVLQSNQPLTITNGGFRSHQNRILHMRKVKKIQKVFNQNELFWMTVSTQNPYKFKLFIHFSQQTAVL